MRNIKLWDEKQKTFLTKFYCFYKDGIFEFYNNDRDFENGIMNTNVIVVEGTGLKDKNNVEIFEGDIVKTNLYNINGYVYYSSPSFGIKQKNGVCTDYNWSDFNNFEVIGNIYEYRSIPAISKIINIPKESIYFYLVKNNIKREKKAIYCECGNIATYLKKTVCKKCYLKDYHAKRKN